MRVTSNRWASFSYLALAALPSGLLLILLQAEGLDSLWAQRHTTMNPIVMVVITLGALAISALSFPNHARSQRFKLYLFCASLLLVASWLLAMPWVPVLPILIYSCPSWLLWRSYRESNARTAA